MLVRDVPDEAAAAMALIENIQREDLNPLEEAQGLQRLIDEFGLTHEQAAQAVGRSRSAATQPAAPAQPGRAGAADAAGRRPRHGPRARAAAARRRASRSSTANEIVAKKLSVREAETLVARAARRRGRQTPLLRAKRRKPRDLSRIEQQLSDALAAAVEIRVQEAHARAAKQGEVAIAFGSLDELNGLLDKLGLPATLRPACAGASQPAEPSATFARCERIESFATVCRQRESQSAARCLLIMRCTRDANEQRRERRLLSRAFACEHDDAKLDA